MNRRRSILKNIAIATVILVALIPTLAVAVRQVLRGYGAAAYTNFYGLAIPYTSVLIFVAVLIAAFFVALAARIIYFWRIGHDGSVKLRKIGQSTDS